MRCPRVIIAGTQSGAGKTTLTLGLLLALKRKGLKIQPFKAGPDYIDPSHHTGAAGKICRNLDSWMLSRDVLLELFHKNAAPADISVIEGVMGLYDGKGSEGEGSTAHLAKILRSPVVLVINAHAMSTSAGAIALGYKKFDETVNLRGVILNNVSGPSHYKYLKDSIEGRASLPVLGFLAKDGALSLPERHLGLVPAVERRHKKEFCGRLVRQIEENIDVNALIRISHSAPRLPAYRKTVFHAVPARKAVRIAVARDEAFHFYYEDNLDILRHYGAETIEFSPLRSRRLPENIQGVHIGGGYPELFAKKLAKNISLKKDLKEKALNGMPLYAECGGLMYLMKQIIDFRKQRFPMLGVFPYSVVMGRKLASMGYVTAEFLKKNVLGGKGEQARGHVFHWSFLKGAIPRREFSFLLRKGSEKEIYDGFSRENILCSYAHFHFGANRRLAENYIQCCEEYGKNTSDK